MPTRTEADSFFPATRWSLVVLAVDAQPETRADALNELLTVYYPVLRNYLIRRRGIGESLADDVLQDFMTDKVLRYNMLERAAAERGRFRSFMVKALDNHVASHGRRDAARKRGPNASRNQIPLEDADLATPEADPSNTYDLAWARQVFDLTVRRMRDECAAKGRGDTWELFRCRILDPILSGEPCPPYEALVERFGYESPAQASNALITAKRVFRRVLAEVVRDTVLDEGDIDSEIADLMDILRNAGSQVV